MGKIDIEKLTKKQKELLYKQFWRRWAPKTYMFKSEEEVIKGCLSSNKGPISKHKLTFLEELVLSGVDIRGYVAGMRWSPSYFSEREIKEKGWLKQFFSSGKLLNALKEEAKDIPTNKRIHFYLKKVDNLPSVKQEFIANTGWWDLLLHPVFIAAQEQYTLRTLIHQFLETKPTKEEVRLVMEANRELFMGDCLQKAKVEGYTFVVETLDYLEELMKLHTKEEDTLTSIGVSTQFYGHVLLAIQLLDVIEKDVKTAEEKERLVACLKLCFQHREDFTENHLREMFYRMCINHDILEMEVIQEIPKYSWDTPIAAYFMKYASYEKYKKEMEELVHLFMKKPASTRGLDELIYYTSRKEFASRFYEYAVERKDSEVLERLFRYGYCLDKIENHKEFVLEREMLSMALVIEHKKKVDIGMFLDSEYDSVRALVYGQGVGLSMLPFETEKVLTQFSPSGYRYDLALWEKSDDEEIQTRYYASSQDYAQDIRAWLKEEKNYDKMGQLLLFNDALRKEVLGL